MDESTDTRDELNQDLESPVGETPKEEDTNDFRRMRDEIDRLKTENRDLRKTAMESAFQQAGFDTAEGVGKLLYQTYKGDPTAAAVAAFAQEEYGLDTQPVAPSEQGEFEERLDQIQAGSVSVTPQEMVDRIAAAERDGDWQSAIALKAQQSRQDAGQTS